MRIGRQFWVAVVFLVFGNAAARAAGELDAHLLGVAGQQPYTWFASTDTGHKNQDFLLLKPGETRSIKLGAGTLARLWSTALEPGKLKLVLHNGRDITLLENGKAHFGEFYQQAFVLYPTASDLTDIRTLGADSTYIATNLSSKENKFFYQIAIRPSGSEPVSPLKPAEEGFSDVIGAVAPGKSLDLVTRTTGAGVIDLIGVTVANGDVNTWKNLQLRAWWDGAAAKSDEQAAAVNVPLLELAGQFWSMGPVDNAFYKFDGKQLALHVPMPYGSGALVRLYNTGEKAIDVKARIQFRSYNPAMPVTLRFCAAKGSARTEHGKPLEMLKVDGGGVFCGLNLGIEPAPGTNRRSFAYLEGNETMTADGKKMEGTGTEDFFDSAWYFPDTAFSHPYNGMTYKKPLPPQVAAYRLLVPDAVPFQKSFDFQFEHGNGNNDSDLLYRWVAFWYQAPPLQFQVPDGLQNRATNSPADGIGSAPQVHWKRILLMVLVAGAVLFVYARRRRG